jgi:hypothetical protein
VELAPALFPPGIDRRRRDAVEFAGQALLPGRIRVDQQLVFAFLEAFGVELEQPRP